MPSGIYIRSEEQTMELIVARIELYEYEIRIAQSMARIKNANNRNVNAKETNYGSIKTVSSEVRDSNAFAGELAYGRIRNLAMNFDLKPRKGGFDFIERDGKRIDVKTRAFRNNIDLLVSKTKIHSSKDHCDYYALMVGGLPSPVFCLHGWIEEKKLIPKMLSDCFSDGTKMEKAGYVCNTTKLLKVYPADFNIEKIIIPDSEPETKWDLF